MVLVSSSCLRAGFWVWLFCGVVGCLRWFGWVAHGCVCVVWVDNCDCVSECVILDGFVLLLGGVC